MVCSRGIKYINVIKYVKEIRDTLCDPNENAEQYKTFLRCSMTSLFHRVLACGYHESAVYVCDLCIITMNTILITNSIYRKLSALFFRVINFNIGYICMSSPCYSGVEFNGLLRFDFISA